MLQDLITKNAPSLISAITNQTGLGQDQAKSALDITKDSLIGSLGKQAASGNLDGILGMLNSGSNLASNSMYQSLLGGLTSSYASKLGINQQLANQVGNLVLHQIVKMISGTKAGSLDKTDLMGMLGKSAGGSLADKAGDLLKGGLGNLFK